MKFLLFLATLLISISALGYPDRPVRMIVAYPPGGGTDIVARYMQAKWQEHAGWNVIIDNRPGATGVVGTTVAARSEPDGYTLLMGHISPNAINPGDFVVPKFSTDWKLEPVAMVAVAPSLLLVQPSLQVNSVQELRAALKDKLPLYGSDGIGSLAHLQMEWFLQGSQKTNVAYKGGAPALQGFLSRDTDLMFSPAPVALSWVRQGRVKVLAQTTSKRINALPDVPTMTEAGELGFEAPLWWAIFAPTGTPRNLIDLWNRETNAILAQSDVREWFERQGYETQPMSVGAFATFVAAEQQKWAELSAKITVEKP